MTVEFIGWDENGNRVYVATEYEAAHKFACHFKPWGMINRCTIHKWKIKI